MTLIFGRSRAAYVLLGALVLAGCTATPRSPPLIGVEPEEPIATITPLAPSPTQEPPSSEPEPTPSPQIRPRIADGATLFRRMADDFQPPVCVRGAHNRSWRRRYTADPYGLEAQLERSMPLLAWVVEQVEARRLPMEFALIPLIESGYRPDARGPGGPTGLWQMIPSTARNHGLIVSSTYDGRLSPVNSTHAALDYLSVLLAEFGDWRAAAMAYNAGEGRLRRALARSGDRRVSGERRLPPGLSSITYAYVAKLHALACLISEPARHGLSLPDDGFIPFEPVLAPLHREHLIRRGDSLWQIARRHGTTVRALAAANGLDVKRPLQIGRVLRIPD